MTANESYSQFYHRWTDRSASTDQTYDTIHMTNPFHSHSTQQGSTLTFLFTSLVASDNTDRPSFLYEQHKQHNMASIYMGFSTRYPWGNSKWKFSIIFFFLLHTRSKKHIIWNKARHFYSEFSLLTTFNCLEFSSDQISQGHRSQRKSKDFLEKTFRTLFFLRDFLCHCRRLWWISGRRHGNVSKAEQLSEQYNTSNCRWQNLTVKTIDLKVGGNKAFSLYHLFL